MSKYANCSAKSRKCRKAYGRGTEKCSTIHTHTHILFAARNFEKSSDITEKHFGEKMLSS